MTRDEVLQQIYDIEDSLALPFATNDISRDGVMQILTRITHMVAEMVDYPEPDRAVVDITQVHLETKTCTCKDIERFMKEFSL